MKTYEIAVVHGDGIGPEVCQAAIDVLKATSLSNALKFIEYQAGANQYLKSGTAFPDETFDRIVSISVFEHIPEPALAELLAEVKRILKPGGLVVLTIDLFLNVKPFTDAVQNEYGHNISVKWLVETSGLELIHGNKSELHGYPEFDFRAIFQNRQRYLVGKYPSMIQTVVLRKPVSAR